MFRFILNFGVCFCLPDFFCLNYMYHIQVDFDICCTFNFFGLISVCLAFSLHFCIDVLLFSYGVESDLDFHLAGWQL